MGIDSELMKIQLSKKYKITISNIEKGYILAITPDLIDINKALRNIYKYKPVEFHSNINLPKEFNE